MQEHMQGLNEKQMEAVLDTEGYVLVFAGAGSGKTRVLTSRIAHLINDLYVSPDEILAITFTNKAADEMRERLSNMVEDLGYMWVSTIHSMCVKILRNSIGRLEGYNKNFSIYSEIDKTNVLKRILTQLKIEDEKYLKNSRFYISDCKNKDIDPVTFSKSTDVKDVRTYAQIYQMYEDELKKSNALDFDDLLLKTYHLLDDDEEVLYYYASKFKYIHIDEFQDTNAIQLDIAKLLSSVHHNLFAVGDDDQSIYGWRGAEIRNILDFERNFKGAKIHKLEQNYRSTKNILDLANAIIKGNNDRKPKQLWTENDVGEKVTVKIAEDENQEAAFAAFTIKRLMLQGEKPSDFAVLMRVNALSRAYEQEFTKYGIPFKVFGGFKFFERKEIKDLTAYMRLIINPLDNESILRIINVPRRGIGDKTVEALYAYAKQYDLSIYDGIVDCELLPLSSSAKNRLNLFRKLINSLMVECSNLPLTEIFERVITLTDFKSQFETKSEENTSKLMNINEYQNAIEEFAKQNPNATLADYLNSITLSSDTDELEEGNFVSIATIHSVKGLEFPNVIVCGLDETIFPISRAADDESELEEERRLMYVAITRAQKRLFLTRANSRFLYGSRNFSAQSMFLTELAPLLGLPMPRRRESTYRPVMNDDMPAPSSSYGSFSTGTKTLGAFGQFNKPQQKPQAQSTSNGEYKTGRKVYHDKFGEGTVIAVRGEGKNTTADVAFPKIGIKSLAVYFAPMKIIK